MADPAVNLTKAQRREWNRLVNGDDADFGLLHDAGLVEASVKIVLSGTRMTRQEVVELSGEGRALLDALKEEGEATHGA